MDKYTSVIVLCVSFANSAIAVDNPPLPPPRPYNLNQVEELGPATSLFHYRDQDGQLIRCEVIYYTHPEHGLVENRACWKVKK